MIVKARIMVGLVDVAVHGSHHLSWLNVTRVEKNLRQPRYMSTVPIRTLALVPPFTAASDAPYGRLSDISLTDDGKRALYVGVLCGRREGDRRVRWINEPSLLYSKTAVRGWERLLRPSWMLNLPPADSKRAGTNRLMDQ